MASNPRATDPESTKAGPHSIFQLGKDQTESMVHMQKEVLDAYEDAGRAWLARVKSEVELWADLASRLTVSRSMPDGVDAYRDCLAKRMRMAADDGKRLFEDGQKIISALTHGLSNNRSKER